MKLIDNISLSEFYVGDRLTVTVVATKYRLRIASSEGRASPRPRIIDLIDSRPKILVLMWKIFYTVQIGLNLIC